MEKYCNRISEIRYDNDLTQREVASYLNTTRSAYSKWERGVNELPLDKLILLSNLYNLSLDYLVGITKKKKEATGNYSSSHLNEKLKQVRKQKKESQQTLSKILNISQRTYSDYETGKVKIPLSVLILFLLHYNLSFDEFLEKDPNFLITT